ncbi:MAG: sensor signal transduction histidine kinase [Patescibacteria group bacterium]|nr:sensor signal transduction histidine kinase [Patescibacteria group bacterium]
MEIISSLTQACEWLPSKFLFFSGNVFSPLVYYSHIFPAILSLVIGGMLYMGNRKRLPNKILFITVAIFCAWSMLDLVLWATPNPEDTVFYWSLVNMLEPLVYMSALYLLYAFINDRLPSFKVQAFIGVLVLPSIILGPTIFNIAGFNLSNCDREAVEGFLVYYNYIIEIIFAIWIVVYGMFKYGKSDQFNKKQILLFTVGLALFLFSFAFGNIVGSVSENWILGQIGIFGLPVFVVFLSVLVTKYHSFKTKTFYAELLVAILWVLIVSMLFVEDMSILKSILVITLIITIFLGVSLIKSVRSQINQNDNLEKLKDRVEISNKSLKVLDIKKNEFLSFATHQLRSPLTSIKWGLDSLKSKYDLETVTHLERTAEDLIGTVNDLLDISKIEQGGMVIKKEEFDFLDFIGRIVEEFRITAEKKNLKVVFEFEHNSYLIEADEMKLRQVFVNLIDNAIKYTSSGTITVSLKHYPKKAIVSVRDTGPGIAKEELELLFDKFIRGAAGRASSSGSGLGLYLAKKIVSIHDGSIYASSSGPGKGSAFTVELPLKK